MVHYEPPAMSRQFEHGRSFIMLGGRIAKGTITAPPITWFGLDLAERLSGRAPRLRASLIAVIQFGSPSGWARPYLQNGSGSRYSDGVCELRPCRVLGAAVVGNIVLQPSRETPGGSNMAAADIQQ